MYSALVSIPASSVSTETPRQIVSSFDHFVTQWMSTVTSSLGSARNSSHVQRLGSSTSPVIDKSHWSSGVCGVGPAERTGKSGVRYWPGGTRSVGPSERLPRKPREMIGGISPPSSGDLIRTSSAASCGYTSRPTLAECEHVRLRARRVEGDLECPVRDLSSLADELIQPRLEERSVPLGVDVEA